MLTISGDTYSTDDARECTREEDVAEQPTIIFHTSEVLCRLKIIEIQRGACSKMSSLFVFVSCCFSIAALRPIQFLTAGVVTGSVGDFAQPSAIKGSTLVLPGGYSLDRAGTPSTDGSRRSATPT